MNDKEEAIQNWFQNLLHWRVVVGQSKIK
jgi:hypothetical protein